MRACRIRWAEAAKVRNQRAVVQPHGGRLAIRARAALRVEALHHARQPAPRVHAQLPLYGLLQPFQRAPAQCTPYCVHNSTPQGCARAAECVDAHHH